ncbi:MAG: hypothetical protein ACAH80_10190 [Alphaproteobacteria bacterium]
MADKTASDMLKEFFARNGGGDEKDWKRLPKKKNEDGQWVRIFENRKTGAMVETVETGPGQFKARRLTPDANASFSGDDGALAATPTIENDPAKNEAADEIIEKMLSFDDEEGGISKSQLNKAGAALANRFVFAVGSGGGLDGFWVEFSPKGGDYDQHLEHVIGHLLPKNNGGELTELTFDFSAYTDPAKLVSDLQKRGFVWDEAYQATMDGTMGTTYLDTVKKAFAAPAAPAAAPKPPTA